MRPTQTSRPAGRRRGPYAKTPARRAAIIEAARESFVEHGFDHASMRDIARRAGMTPAGLLHHFQDKAQLLAEVFRQSDATGRERSESSEAAGGSPADILVAVLRHSQEDPRLARLWLLVAAGASDPAHPMHAFVTERYAAYRTEIEADLRQASAAGLLAPGVDPAAAAALILSVFNGLQLQWLLDPDLDVLGAMRQFAQSVFRDG